MEHVMLSADLMEVRGAASETSARLYAERTTGRIVQSVTHIVLGVYQVALR